MKKELSDTNSSIFEQIREVDENGNEYWGARKLSKVLGYSEYRHFLPVIEKAKETIRKNGLQIVDHFEEYLEEISHGKGAKQAYSSIKLTYLGCYNIVLNADSGKENVRLGLEYFNAPKQEIQTVETQTEANLIFYTTPQGNTRIDLAYDGETFWITQKKISELFDVEANTISYHLSQIFESEELNKYSVVRKIRITASDGKDYLTNV